MAASPTLALTTVVGGSALSAFRKAGFTTAQLELLLGTISAGRIAQRRSFT